MQVPRVVMQVVRVGILRLEHLPQHMVVAEVVLALVLLLRVLAAAAVASEQRV
jgi:hypothetical protein